MYSSKEASGYYLINQQITQRLTPLETLVRIYDIIKTKQFTCKEKATLTYLLEEFSDTTQEGRQLANDEEEVFNSLMELCLDTLG